MDNLSYGEKKRDLIDFIKRMPQIQHIPVILLTIKGLTEDRINGYELGCNAYIPKPFDPRELTSIIKNLKASKKIWIKYLIKSYLIARHTRICLLRKVRSFARIELRLTKTERIILKKILSNLKPRTIAQQLNTTQRNVEKCISRLMDKTQTSSSLQLKSLPWSTILITLKANGGIRTKTKLANHTVKPI
jgi:DNA-binding NarL/FixJ family response regulator